MRKWFRNWIGSPESPPQAHILFVDGENSPPDPDLMMEAVLSHAGCELDLALAWAKWWPQMLLLKRLREVGVECIQADEGSNNADIMLSLRAMKEVNKRAALGQGGIAYVAFGTDKGFSHLLREIRTTKGWKSVYVTSFEDPPSILAQSSSEVLYVRRPGRGEKKPVKSLPPKKSSSSEVPIITKSSAENEKAAGSIEEYVELILSLIGDDTVSSLQLDKRIREYQTKQNWDEIGSKSLLSHFGIPKYYHNESGNRQKTSTSRTIEWYLSEHVEIMGRRPIYSYKKKETPAVMESLAKSRSKLTQSSSSEVPKITKSSDGNERVAGSIEEYVELILSLIGDDTVSSPQLDKRIREYQVKQNWDEMGPESLFSYFGIPKFMPNRDGIIDPTTIDRTIQLYLPEVVEITGTPPVYSYKKKEIPAVKESPAKSDYPMIMYLNSSTKGLRFPAEPRQLADTLLWLASNGGDFQTLAEQRDALKESGISSRHRLHHTISHIHRATKIGRFSTERSFSIDELPEICDNMLSNCLKIPDRYPIEKEDAERYFEEVKSALSDLIAQPGDSG